MMKITSKIGGLLILLLLSSLASASTYLEELRELDIRVVCLVVWIAPLATLLLLAIAGLRFIISETPEKKNDAQSMLINSILGIIIVFSFILLAGFLGNLDLTRCLGDFGKPPEEPIFPTPSTTILAPNCELYDTCENCLDNGCGWCPTLPSNIKCFPENTCDGECYQIDPDGFPYLSECITIKVHCPEEPVTTAHAEIIVEPLFC